MTYIRVAGLEPAATAPKAVMLANYTTPAYLSVVSGRDRIRTCNSYVQSRRFPGTLNYASNPKLNSSELLGFI